jgi:glutamate carboxypeptidase
MLACLKELVETESFSADAAAVTRCADVVARIGSEMLGVEPEVTGGDHPIVRFTFGTEPSRVVLLGHFDTVWPIGTLDRWPFSVSDGVATGPGIFDMKAGVVQGLFALASLDRRDGVTLLLNSDEELGSDSSRASIEEVGGAAEAVLVLEPSEKGALKIARKGQAGYRATAHGRAAHAGLNPWDGANALVQIAHTVLALEAVASGDTTVTPTLAKAGTTSNTVPALATVDIDVRASTIAEQRRANNELLALGAQVPGVRLDIECLTIRPPLEASASEALFARANALAGRLGLEPLEGVQVGGASDGNWTAALGTPTLDGLGAVGGGAHAEGEHVIVDKMAERTTLVAALVTDLLKEG